MSRTIDDSRISLDDLLGIIDALRSSLGVERRTDALFLLEHAVACDERGMECWRLRAFFQMLPELARQRSPRATEVAERLRTTAWELSRLLNQTGHGFHWYVARTRCMAAALALRTTRESVANIADQVGYRSSSQLSRAFRAQMGVTPKAYRRRHVEESVAPQEPGNGGRQMLQSRQSRPNDGMPQT